MPHALQANYHHLTPARTILSDKVTILPVSTGAEAFSELVGRGPEVSAFLVEEDDTIVNVITWEHALAALERRAMAPESGLGELERHAFVTVGTNASVVDIMRSMRRGKASLALVTDAPGAPTSENVMGVITRDLIEENLEESLSIFTD